jgi:phosphatidate cytidylyltransferase
MTRWITGAILMAIASYVLVYSGLPLIVFLGVAGVGAFYELWRMMGSPNKWVLSVPVGGYIMGMMVLYGGGRQWVMGIWGVHMLVLMGFVVELYRQQLWGHGGTWRIMAKYFLYIFCGLSSIYLIREAPNGPMYLLILCVSIWSTDICAYVGGRLVGRTPLSVVSPKKTVEGTAIGVLSAGAMVAMICVLSQWSLMWALGAVGLGVMGQVGDLYESLIKRRYGVKDSSTLLPGHGGILDRGDSTLMVAPIVYMVVMWLG